MKTQTRRILFPLAGAVLGMLAGAGFGMDVDLHLKLTHQT